MFIKLHVRIRVILYVCTVLYDRISYYTEMCIAILSPEGISCHFCHLGILQILSVIDILSDAQTQRMIYEQPPYFLFLFFFLLASCALISLWHLVNKKYHKQYHEHSDDH